MSQSFTIELSDEVCSLIRRKATASGKSPDGLILEAVEQAFANGTGAENEKRGAVRKYFGAYHSGRPSGADNEQIDADLVREYGDDHEPR